MGERRDMITEKRGEMTKQVKENSYREMIGRAGTR
jgi:hypothetical protein